jgi:hypothetical protein
MSEMSSIQYKGFYDVPLIFITRYRSENYLFDCPFDEEREDDSEFYNVYLFPEFTDEELPNDWTTLHTQAIRCVGQIPVAGVKFDATRRAAVDASIIDTLNPDKPLIDEIRTAE